MELEEIFCDVKVHKISQVKHGYVTVRNACSFV